MHISYGMEPIRCWWPAQKVIGPPLLYSRRKGGPRVEPRSVYRGRWIEDVLTGRVYPLVSGGLGLQGSVGVAGAVLVPYLGPPSGPATTSLNNNYVAGTSGNAAACRIWPTENLTLSYLYFWINSFTGTAASVTDINVELRSEASFFLPTTASSLNTGTVDPASNIGWIKGPVFNASLTAATPYWGCVGDANGSGTNFALISRGGTNGTYQTLQQFYSRHPSYTTSAGFTAATFEGRVSQIVAVFSNGGAIGDPFSTSALPTSDANQKGLYISGLLNSLTIYGMIGDVSSANLAGISVWAGTHGPGSNHGTDADGVGTTIIPVASGNKGGAYLATPYTLAANTAYRIVFRSGASNAQIPRKLQIGTVGVGSTADLLGAFPGGGGCYWTAESSGSWVDDLTAFPAVGLYILDQVAPVGGGGGGAGAGLGAIILG